MRFEEDSRRQGDVIVKELLEELRSMRSESKEWREKFESKFNGIDSRIDTLERFIDRVNTPLKGLAWMGGIVIASIFGAVGLKLVKWFETHWHWG